MSNDDLRAAVAAKAGNRHQDNESNRRAASAANTTAPMAPVAPPAQLVRSASHQQMQNPVRPAPIPKIKEDDSRQNMRPAPIRRSNSFGK